MTTAKMEEADIKRIQQFISTRFLNINMDILRKRFNDHGSSI